MLINGRYLKTLVSIAVLSLTSAGARADIIDFVDMADGNVYGESAYSNLVINGTNFVLTITAEQSDSAALAYLDFSHAGLGVCDSLKDGASEGEQGSSSSNVCHQASDDNVTFGEMLHFTFNTNVVIDKIWFNNTHDPNPSGIIGSGEYIWINGSDIEAVGNGYATGNANNNIASLNASADNFLGPYSVSGGVALDIGFASEMGEQFYISGMEVRSVPEPGTLALLGIGLLGMGATRRRRRKA